MNFWGRILIRKIIRHPCTYICFRLKSAGRTSSGRVLQKPRTQPNIKTNIFRDGGIFFLLIPVSTLYLGIDQLYKNYKRKAELKDFMEKSLKEPISLPKNLDDIDSFKYQSVKVRGTFDHEHPMFIGPRSYAPDKPRKGREGHIYIRMQREFGFHLIVPFKLSDKNVYILVNRGFIPGKVKEEYFQTEQNKIKPLGEVELVGVVKADEKINILRKVKPKPVNERYQVDIKEISEFLGTEPVYIEADKASTIDGDGPVGGLTEVKLRNDHFGYISTCLGISFLTGYLWRRRFIRPVPAKTLFQLYYKDKGV